jgi:hypothetical protein
MSERDPREAGRQRVVESDRLRVHMYLNVDVSVIGGWRHFIDKCSIKSRIRVTTETPILRPIAPSLKVARRLSP